MTGPVFIREGPPREHLIEHGWVYVFRATTRSTGETHVRFEYGGRKQFDATVEKIAEVTLHGNAWDFGFYIKGSGYDYAGQWRAALKEVYNREISEGYIYEVQAADDYRQHLKPTQHAIAD